ncbi:MAG: NAD(P)H-dependent oxidoreductase [Gemmatimonadetes bacterium]|nr:NAD(P)H-dependent oxidoreductase [Gemmatimonadota bacterium]MYA76548.1 NAD(P)H-dependent oxidoreductase [Gemmatimonadota bacterium]MYG17609.1 NAD(P)H-dependent oxidoreductase [Gemmatimonadota bacterium]MYH18254.1 NAD(P)H-dependent oxidoreductase [Gemmatimonadota bacterium]MYK98467.1 NAD(P)H-dependent oxidoreductase [Gemmatimonadota bacterium]
MSYVPRILAFAGSARTGSFNRKLVGIAARGAEEAGAEVDLVDLRDFPMPLYDGDLEERDGLPENAVRFKALMMASQGLLIAAPEYNSSITPLLKNTIDWASRPAPGEERLAVFQNKTAALMSASPGSLGGLRGLVHVRSILSNIHVMVLPDQVALPGAHGAFTDDGRLKDERRQAAVEGLGRNLAETLGRLHGATALNRNE